MVATNFPSTGIVASTAVASASITAAARASPAAARTFLITGGLLALFLASLRLAFLFRPTCSFASVSFLSLSSLLFLLATITLLTDERFHHRVDGTNGLVLRAVVVLFIVTAVAFTCLGTMVIGTGSSSAAHLVCGSLFLANV